MSQSPDTSEEDNREYAEGWSALYQLAREGKSFSGREKHCAFLNTGDGRFANVSSVGGVDLPEDGRALGVCDWNLDGALDFWMSARSAPRLRLFRNTRRPQGDWIALRLRGTDSNRDAIGARVELELDGGRRLVRQLFAGETFLSQSSKWLHFGLGASAHVQAALVHWPNGATERFEGLAAGRRFALVEGSGAAEPWQPPAGTALDPMLASDPLDVPPRPAGSIVRAAAPMPLLGMDFVDETGAERRIEGRSGRTQVVNLWASWCPNCRKELKHWTADADRLRAAGIDVWALSADEPGDRPAAREVLAVLEWPFDSGYVDDSFLDRFEILFGVLVTQPETFVLPSSLVVDEDGRLVAVVRGHATAEELIALTEPVGKNLAEARRRASAHEGRWILPATPARLSTLANRLRQAGHLEMAGEYLAGISVSAGGAAAEGELEARERLSATMGSLGVELREKGRIEEALVAFESSLRAHPGRADILVEIGNTHRAQGRLPQAVESFRRALESDPEFGAAHYNLGLLLALKGETDAAREHFEATVRTMPEHPRVRFNLAILFARRGEFEPALQWARAAVEHDPEHIPAHSTLAQLHRLREEYAQAIDACRGGLEHAADSTALRNELGLSLALSGQFDAAREEQGWLATRDPSAADTLSKVIEAAVKQDGGN